MGIKSLIANTFSFPPPPRFSSVLAPPVSAVCVHTCGLREQLPGDPVHGTAATGTRESPDPDRPGFQNNIHTVSSNIVCHTGVRAGIPASSIKGRACDIELISL